MRSYVLTSVFVVQLVVAYKCNDYNKYVKDTNNFIKQCSKREYLAFDKESPVVDAKKFDGDDFNVFFSKLRRFEVCIRVQATQLKRVAFPAIRQKANTRCREALASIVIRDNPNLEEIVFGDANRVRADCIPTLMVRGNPKLSNKTITRLNELKTGARASKRNSIQAFGECFVPKPLTNLNDLIGCKSLHGDVVIKGETLRPPREPLRPFVLTGCVIVKRSKVENVDFLRNLEAIKEPAWLCKNEITENPNLCIHEKMERLIRSRIGDLNITLPEECEVVCTGGVVTPDYLATNIADHQCAIIKGDLILKNWAGDSSTLHEFRSVRKIIGVLHVVDNPKVEKLDFLTGLEEIDAEESTEPALLISGNSVLKEVQLIGLKKVRSKASPAVVIENNPKLVGDVEEWYEIAGGANRTRVLFAEVEGTEQADKKPLVFIVLVVVVMMALALTVYWFGWGTRWRRFSGLHEGHTITKAPKKGSKRRTKK